MTKWDAPVPLEQMRDGLLGIRAAILTAALVDAKPADPELKSALEDCMAEIARRGDPEDAKIGFAMFMP